MQSALKLQTKLLLTVLLTVLTLVFLIVVATVSPLANYVQSPTTVAILISLLVALIPTTIGGLLSAIGIAGMNRVAQFNVIATSGRAVEACGDINTLVLDKTGTITLGNRLADEFIPVNGHTNELILNVTSDPGQGFIDRMISLVEGAERTKTPNEIALTVLLTVLTLVFLIVVATVSPLANYVQSPTTVAILISLLVASLIPTTIGGLLSAIGSLG